MHAHGFGVVGTVVVGASVGTSVGTSVGGIVGVTVAERKLVSKILRCFSKSLTARSWVRNRNRHDSAEW